MSGKKPRAKKKPTAQTPGPPWQVIVEEIRSQNRVAREAEQAQHERTLREIRNFRDEFYADMATLRTIVQGHSIDIRDPKAGMARVDAVDKLVPLEERVAALEQRRG